MEEITFQFETPRPISFRDICYEGLELEAGVCGSVAVTEHDERYGAGEAATVALKLCALSLLPACLAEYCKDHTVSGSGVKGALAGLLTKELEKNGVTATVEISSFELTEDSKRKTDEAVRKSISGMHWDVANKVTEVPPPVDGPGYDNKPGPGDPGIISDCGGWPPNPATLPKAFMGMHVIMQAGQEPQKINRAGDKFCRNCGTRRGNGAKFCTECGTKYEI